MDLDEFAALVRQMRRVQRDYFLNKRPTTLERAKAAERAVDAALEQIAQGPTMFSNEE